MGERKVLNKYIPADFDPSLVPRGPKLSKKDGTVPVRMMLPFSIQCSTCNTFLYRGRKYNSKKEPMGGPDGRYLGIQRFRFYIKCNHCSRTISFLTDPANADYEMESGGTRNYEVNKEKKKAEEESALEKEQDEKEDPMRALENRVLDSQREIADMDNLEEILAMNRKHVKLVSSTGEGFDADAKAVLEAREAGKKKKSSGEEEKILNEHGITEEEEKLVKSIQFGRKKTTNNNNEPDQLTTVRLSEEDELREEAKRKQEAELIRQRQLELEQKVSKAKAIQPIIKVKRKKVVNNQDTTVKKQKVEPAPAEKPNGLASLLGGYGSDSNSD
jgi:hypothetical protein